jgi:hypothetical protein
MAVLHICIAQEVYGFARRTFRSNGQGEAD